MVLMSLTGNTISAIPLHRARHDFCAFLSAYSAEGVDEGSPGAVECLMAAPGSLRELLVRTVDYAGLFPPCSLELGPALANQAEYVRSPDEWLLSTFVLPIARFQEAEAHLSSFNRDYPLRISALGPRSDGPAQFISLLKAAMNTVRSFSERHVGVAKVTQLEMPLPPNADAAVLAEAGGIGASSDVQTFWEAPANQAEETIDLLADYNLKDSDLPVGFKLRTGGVTADAFPTGQQIARALVAAVYSRVSIKFTAGLHHPVRQHRDEVQTKMHGFLNVLGAGVMAAQHRWSESQTTQMLESEEASAFHFDEDFFRWQDWEVRRDQVASHRKLITSFGSCSFNEPREDLRALGLL